MPFIVLSKFQDYEGKGPTSEIHLNADQIAYYERVYENSTVLRIIAETLFVLETPDTIDRLIARAQAEEDEKWLIRQQRSARRNR